jgi:hypothetical protein
MATVFSVLWPSVYASALKFERQADLKVDEKIHEPVKIEDKPVGRKEDKIEPLPVDETLPPAENTGG